MFQPETKFLQTALGGQERCSDLIAEFCAIWAESVVEEKRHVKDGEASHRSVHPVLVDCLALKGEQQSAMC